MHENIVTKRNIQGAPIEVRAMIFVPENCVIIHTGQCHVTAQTTEGRKICTEHLIIEEGEGKITEWLDKLNESTKTSFPLW